MEIWESIKTGRETFADYLAALPAAAWSAPSLCEGWTVKDVVAHLLVVPTKSKGEVFRAFAGSGFNLDKMNAKFVAKIGAEMSTAQMASALRTSAASRSMPPGLKVPGVLNELAVHAADVSEAVGTPFDLPAGDYLACLDHLKGVQPVFGTKKRIAGLTVRTTDAAWSTGSGPIVEGEAKQVLLALAGRKRAFEHLSGDGVASLKSRR
ncbi:MAG: maleylpyruvate isomerase family mycothiol-dependent enzyme [Acidimicrobiia bacterium]